MAQYFSLTPKDQQRPQKPVDVDAAICEALGKTCHSTDWYENWYNTLGLALACGRDLDYVRKEWPQLKDVADFIEANYVIDAWAGR